MKNKGSKNLLTITLAALIVLSTAAASVMSGCGDNAESVNATTNVVETSIVTEIIEYTQVVTDNKNVEETKATNKKPENNENSETKKPQNGNSNSSSNNSGNNLPQNNAGNGVVEKPEKPAIILYIPRQAVGLIRFHYTQKDTFCTEKTPVALWPRPLFRFRRQRRIVCPDISVLQFLPRGSAQICVEWIFCLDENGAAAKVLFPGSSGKI